MISHLKLFLYRLLSNLASLWLEISEQLFFFPFLLPIISYFSVCIYVVEYITIIIYSSEFSPSANADGLSLEFEWQQVSSSLKNSSQYSSRFQ